MLPAAGYEVSHRPNDPFRLVTGVISLLFFHFFWLLPTTFSIRVDPEQILHKREEGRGHQSQVTFLISNLIKPPFNLDRQTSRGLRDITASTTIGSAREQYWRVNGQHPELQYSTAAAIKRAKNWAG